MIGQSKKNPSVDWGYQLEESIIDSSLLEEKLIEKIEAQMIDEIRQVERAKLLACSQEDVEQFILESINHLKETGDAWKRGDSEAILPLSQNEFSGFEELSEQVHSKRNVPMTGNIDHVLRTKEGPHLFAVGAAHLPGDDGIVKLLEKKGWTLRKT